MFVWNKSVYLLSFSFLCFVSVSLWRENRNGALVACTLVEVHHAVGQSIQSVVLALSNVLTGIVLVTTLANDDVAGNDLLTTPNLYA